MKPFTLTIKARGSLLIGGGDVADGLHGAHTSDRRGRPLVPASALRGALRETLEALLRGVDLPACDAGRGHPPSLRGDETSRACALDDGRPCVACRLFGGGREKLLDNAREFSSLVLGDGTLAGDTTREWMVRPGVAVGRRQRSAEENRLFLRRTTATGAVFVAEGFLRDDSLRREFAAAVAATTHIGAGRSRGQARVDLTLVWGEVAAQKPLELPEGDVVLRLTLRSPTTLGVPLAKENLRDTRRDIPGSALRGAIGFALAAVVADPDHDPGFQALVEEDHGARFGFLSPVTGAPTNAPTGRLPLTSQRCKQRDREHGLHDDLLDRIATALITDAKQVASVQSALRASKCAKCGKPLRSAHGFRRCDAEPRVRVATRASIARGTASVRDGALFTEVYLEPGNVFEGRVRGVSDDAREMLARGLSLPLSIGRARGAGRGRASVELVTVAPRASVASRAERFEAALTRHLARCKLPETTARRLVTLTFLTPCVASIVDHDEWSGLAATLPERLRDATPLVRVRRFVREGSWDQRTGQMHAWQAIAAGSVYVLELPEGLRSSDVLDELAEIERAGLGTRRHQGYGEVLVFDPIHVEDVGGTHG